MEGKSIFIKEVIYSKSKREQEYSLIKNATKNSITLVQVSSLWKEKKQSVKLRREEKRIFAGDVTQEERQQVHKSRRICEASFDVDQGIKLEGRE